MTHERSIVSNLEASNVNPTAAQRMAANVADIVEGWEYEDFEATYHAQEIPTALREQAGEISPETEKALLARCDEWARNVGRQIMADRSASLADRISRFVALHDPAMTEAELAAALKAAL